MPHPERPGSRVERLEESVVNAFEDVPPPEAKLSVKQRIHGWLWEAWRAYDFVCDMLFPFVFAYVTYKSWEAVRAADTHWSVLPVAWLFAVGGPALVVSRILIVRDRLFSKTCGNGDPKPADPRLLAPGNDNVVGGDG